MLPQLVLVAGNVFAEPPPPPDHANKTWALAIGIAIDAVSFAIGAATLGSDSLASDRARVGWITCSAGFMVAPFVSHAIVGQWLRGAAFSAVPLAGVIGNAFVLGQNPNIDQMELNPDQRLVYAFTTAGLLGSFIGLLDVALYKPSKPPPVRIAPTVSHGGAGLVLGGSF
jgi:hypothetical protein